MEKLNEIIDKINALSLRERVMVFIGIVAVVYTVWDSYLISPLVIKQKALIADLNTTNAKRLEMNVRMQELIADSQQDPDKKNLDKLKMLRSKLIEVQAELEASTTNLVTPKEMPSLLESVLDKTGNLTLVSLKSLGVSPLVENKGEEKPTEANKNANKPGNLSAENIDNAFKHGLRIEFEGDYFSTMDYLQALESLQWGFFWDSFELKVRQYPSTNAVIEVFTLGLSQEWIGV